jgi:hypothetical protein
MPPSETRKSAARGWGNRENPAKDIEKIYKRDTKEIQKI